MRMTRFLAIYNATLAFAMKYGLADFMLAWCTVNPWHMHSSGDVYVRVGLIWPDSAQSSCVIEVSLLHGTRRVDSILLKRTVDDVKSCYITESPKDAVQHP